MGHKKKLRSFRSVLQKHQAILLDSFGVIKNYKGLIPGVMETIDFMKSEGKQVLILTNDSSKSPARLAENFYNLGLRGIREVDIISSGMMAMYFLKNKIKRGRIVYVGTEESSYYVKGLNLPCSSINDVDINDLQDVTALVFLDDEGFDWKEHLNKTVNLLRHKSIPVIVANSDSTYPVSKNEVSIATGELSKMIERISKKKFIYFGKPDSQMFMHAYEKVLERITLNRKEVLMVGDTLSLDILGGNKFGLSTALVLSGNTAEDQMRLYIKSTGIIPDYICPSIALDM